MKERFQENLVASETQESSRESIILPPASLALFFSGTLEANDLSEEITANPELQAQAELRRKLYFNLGEIYAAMHDVTQDIDYAIASGAVSEAKTASLYRDLTAFLKNDENNERLILYLPFELLPNLNTKNNYSEELSTARKQFTDTYLTYWRDLLTHDDVRANFVDGDIKEALFGSGQPPRVRKAAHFIPELLKKGLIDKAEVTSLAGDRDELLRTSITETFPLLAAKKPIFPTENVISFQTPESPNPPHVSEKQTLQTIVNQLHGKYNKLLHQFDTNAESAYGVPERRLTWEKQQRLQNLTLQFGQKISQAYLDRTVSLEHVLSLTSEGKHDVLVITCILALTQIGDTLSETNMDEAKRVAEAILPSVEKTRERDSAEVTDAVNALWYHWVHAGIVSEEKARAAGIVIPYPDALIPSGMESVLTKYSKQLNTIIARIKEDDSLTHILYPTILLYGSRLQGYATGSADLDVALFFKPEATLQDRGAVEEKLHAALPELGFIEYFLEEHEGDLHIRKMPLVENTIAEKAWVHVLLGGMWFGDEKTTKQIAGNLLNSYLSEEPQMITDRFDTRAEYLRTIERGVLQYRLMHKVYPRLYPNRNQLNLEAAQGIDGESHFWDPGYRRIATRLFISKVFLPHIKL